MLQVKFRELGSIAKIPNGCGFKIRFTFEVRAQNLRRTQLRSAYYVHAIATSSRTLILSTDITKVMMAYAPIEVTWPEGSGLKLMAEAVAQGLLKDSPVTAENIPPFDFSFHEYLRGA